MYGLSSSEHQVHNLLSTIAHSSILTPLCFGCWEAQNEDSYLLLEGTAVQNTSPSVICPCGLFILRL